jgi:alpha-ribazole phosphatase
VKLLLLRHGATQGTLQKRYLGSTDQPLCDLGWEQALNRRPFLPSVEALWCSPLLRCRETAELLFPGQEPRVLDGLRELDFGTWEGRTWAEVGDERVYDRWLSEDPGAAFPGGEALGDFRRRINSAFRCICTDCGKQGIGTAAAVIHGGVIMGLLSEHAKPHRDYFDWFCAPCGGYAALLEPETGALTQVTPLGEELPW